MCPAKSVLYGNTPIRGGFPNDFVFELTSQEFANLKSQFAIPSGGGRRKLPLAFAEHGAIMAATVLNSQQAVELSVYMVRAFVRLREMITSNKELGNKSLPIGVAMLPTSRI